MNIKIGNYVRWTGERLKESEYVSNIYINRNMVPFTDGIPRKVLGVVGSHKYCVLLEIEGIEFGIWNYPVSQIEVVNNKYITTPIKGYPEWLKDIPRGEAVLCNVWDDGEPTRQKYVIDYSGEERECPYMAINNWCYKHAEPILRESGKLDELKAKYRELGEEIRKLEEAE